MKLRRLMIAMGVALLAAGCSVVRVTDVQFDPKHDFSSYQSFDFLDGLVVESGDERTDSPQFHQAIRASIVETLTDKGYRHTPGKTVDFKVGYHTAIKLEISYTARGVPTAYGYGSVASYGSEAWSVSSIDDYEQGTVIIDVVDVKQNTSVWRGTAKTEVDHIPTVDSAKAKIAKVVSKTLSSFPPD